MRIGCLHTAQSNVAVFDSALANHFGHVPNVVLEHRVCPQLLADAEAAGGLTPAIAAQTVQVLRELAESCDAVLLTCSTLGPAMDALSAPVPVLRVDAALARQAVAGGGQVRVLYAAETTLASTRELFARAARSSGATVGFTLVAGAWEKFRTGDTAAYFRLVAEAAERAYAGGADVVALAQASMAGAVVLVRHEKRPLSSPVCGLAEALAAMGREV